MNFELSDEDVALQDSVARWLRQRYPFEARRGLTAGDAGFSAMLWREMAQLGWLALPFDEAQGGLGGGALTTMLMMEALGKGLVLEPYLPTVLLFGGALKRCPALAAAWLPQLIEGQVQGALACTERHSRHELCDVQCTLQRVGDGYVLNGEKSLVFNGSAADQLVVVARSSGGRFDSHGISLALVDAKAPGLSRTALQLMDGQRVANVRFDNVAVPADRLLCAEGSAAPLLHQVVLDAMLALCAEGFGVMQTLHATTLEYVKTRKQFGVPIGSFQALQHRLVDMFAGLEQTRSLLYRAVCAVQDGGADSERCIVALKAMVGKAGRLIGAEAIQMHGGMGMTDELIVGHGMKRLMVINTTFGDADHQLQRFAALATA